MRTRNHTHCTRCSARYDEHTVPARACPDRAGVFAKAEPQRGGASMSFTDAEVQMLARVGREQGLQDARQLGAEEDAVKTDHVLPLIVFAIVCVFAAMANHWGLR